MPLLRFRIVKEGRRDRIVFVCTGNTCRSPMAQIFFEHYVRDIPEMAFYTIISAGIKAYNGQKSSSGAQTVVKDRGFSLENHRAQLLTQEIIDGAIAVICATSAQEKFLKNNFVNLPKICTSFVEFGGDIADPCGGDLENYRKIADEIEQKLPSVIKFLREEFNDH